MKNRKNGENQLIVYVLMVDGTVRRTYRKHTEETVALKLEHSSTVYPSVKLAAL
ncbi:MAG: hypothetical protein ACO3XO_01850 [Bdellovibrionota bacterium]|jgi:hypothetical protein